MSVLFNGTALADLNYSARLSANATTVVTALDTFVTSIAYNIEVAGSGGNTLTIEDGSGTPRILVNAVSTTSPSTTPTILSFGYPGIKMVGGIKIIIATGSAATIDVWAQGVQ